MTTFMKAFYRAPGRLPKERLMLVLWLLPCPPAAVNMVDDCGGVKPLTAWKPPGNPAGLSQKGCGNRSAIGDSLVLAPT
jgi:hypothetical protein